MLLAFIIGAFTHAAEFLVAHDGKDIILTEERWRHITEGVELDDGFSGGHDFKTYFKTRSKANVSIVFDHNINAIVVETKKGDSFFEILKKITSGNARELGFHSFFPHGTLHKNEELTPGFICDAFADAIAKGQKQRRGDSFLALTTYDDIHVQVLFKHDTNGNYLIHTAYPEIEYHYKAKTKTGDDHIDPSQFSVWHDDDGSWQRQGPITLATFSPALLAGTVPDEKNQIVLSLMDHANNISTQQFLTQNMIKEYAEQSFDGEKVFDVFNIAIKYPKVANAALSELIPEYRRSKSVNDAILRDHLITFFSSSADTKLTCQAMQINVGRAQLARLMLKNNAHPTGGLHLARLLVEYAFVMEHAKLMANHTHNKLPRKYRKSTSPFFEKIVQEFLKKFLTEELTTQMSEQNVALMPMTVSHDRSLILQMTTITNERNDAPFAPSAGPMIFHVKPGKKNNEVVVTTTFR